ncbi:type VI secretion system baseplate subunit TssF [Sulfitobacter sp. G21635-S1]|uniref:type VI secretion system baseplate subunit TssF n=1 Tax=Sulfitobacter sp. G21635-S1 TaxID=3014043 RepID=UPI0022B04EE3|nr:type VI secretion system baseplate subunit TssF [Sulfitobacter sp. G21635-S1]MCZ4255600.1 type VI secretion system baseplate subunit TssF [Sulfitobacter sp. G21635-S1]
MDQAFLQYYEDELTHIRSLAGEFAALHPNVAGNLSITSVPCPDPYVERLLEGVAFLAARTRLKIDVESSRYVRNLLDALYPDLAGPAPAMTMATLTPGPQVDRMLDGHQVRRGTRLVASLREGLQTRATYTTSQTVHLWPIMLAGAEYLQDRGALAQAGVPETQLRDHEAGLRITIKRRGAGSLSELSLKNLDLYFGAGARGGAIFDALFGFGGPILSRPADKKAPFDVGPAPAMIGVGDDDALLPRVRSSFEGYRLLREYFLMPERFFATRLAGLGDTIRRCEKNQLEVIVLLRSSDASLSGVKASDFRLFAAPIVNLFEHECNLVDLSPHRPGHLVHADRTRPWDFEIYRLLRVEDADAQGPGARVTPLFSVEQQSDSGHVYAFERRPRRPNTDEVRRGQTRSSYGGDDFYVSVARPANRRDAKPIRRLDIRALCTNRDLPILDDTPRLTLETGDPVTEIDLLRPMRRPRPSLRATLPSGAAGESQLDDLTWRWISQLSLNHISLAADEKDAEPLRALIQLYARRGDPNLARHGQSVTRVSSTRLIERIARPGPVCFGHGTEITLDIDDTVLSGGSRLLLSALLAQLFTRHTGINSFVRTRTRLSQTQTEISWPMTPGTRAQI